MSDAPKPDAKAPEADPVDTHPLASRLRRAIAAHPILKGQKKLLVEVELGRAKVIGQVYTQDMLRQTQELIERAADGGEVIVAVEAEVKLPAGRSLEGRVPPVSPGAGATKRNFSVNHLPKRG